MWKYEALRQRKRIMFTTLKMFLQRWKEHFQYFSRLHIDNCEGISWM